ncbi:hypothetical protein [Hymenobacter bucti]|uniref:Uncharacterized protein n=1 Tax=Hymenobacter bucti TaxID=1844114 RepID=A0ABW4QT42_9BACT
MERFYDVTVNGEPRRLELHSTSVVEAGGKARIDIHVDVEALTDTLPADVGSPFDAAAQAARAALASVSLSYLYPDQSYQEVLRRRELAQDAPPQA